MTSNTHLAKVERIEEGLILEDEDQMKETTIADGDHISLGQRVTAQVAHPSTSIDPVVFREDSRQMEPTSFEAWCKSQREASKALKVSNCVHLKNIAFV